MILDSTVSNKAPKRGGTSIRRLVSTSSRTPATTGPHREDDIHLSPNPVYSMHSANLLHTEDRPPAEDSSGLHSEDAIQLSPNPVYAIHSSASGAECLLQHSPPQESSNSSGQGNQTASHSGDAIQMLPNPLYAIRSKDSSALQGGAREGEETGVYSYAYYTTIQ